MWNKFAATYFPRNKKRRSGKEPLRLRKFNALCYSAAIQIDADDLADAGLLHRDAIDHVSL